MPSSSSHAKLNSKGEVVEKQLLRLPLHPRSLPHSADTTPVSERTKPDIQNPSSHVLQVQTLHSPSQPIGCQGVALQEATAQ